MSDVAAQSAEPHHIYRNSWTVAPATAAAQSSEGHAIGGRDGANIADAANGCTPEYVPGNDAAKTPDCAPDCAPDAQAGSHTRRVCASSSAWRASVCARRVHNSEVFEALASACCSRPRNTWKSA